MRGVATFSDSAIDKLGSGYTLAATASLYMGASSQPFDVTLGPVSGVASTLVITPNSVVADGLTPATVTVTVVDAGGNPLVGQTVNLNVSGSASFLLDTTGTTDMNGQVVTTLTSTVAEPKIVTALIGTTMLTGSVTFTAGAPVLGDSTLTAQPNANVPADGLTPSMVTLTLADAYGNPIPSWPVTFGATGAGSVITPAAPATDATGTLNATLVSTSAQTVIVSATAGTLMITDERRLRARVSRWHSVNDCREARRRSC